jgi:hypothetical protein
MMEKSGRADARFLHALRLKGKSKTQNNKDETNNLRVASHGYHALFRSSQALRGRCLGTV